MAFTASGCSSDEKSDSPEQSDATENEVSQPQVESVNGLMLSTAVLNSTFGGEWSWSDAAPVVEGPLTITDCKGIYTDNTAGDVYNEDEIVAVFPGEAYSLNAVSAEAEIGLSVAVLADPSAARAAVDDIVASLRQCDSPTDFQAAQIEGANVAYKGDQALLVQFGNVFVGVVAEGAVAPEAVFDLLRARILG